MISGPPRLWDYANLSTEHLFAKTGNTGNLAFRYAVYKHLNRKAKILPWGASPEAVHLAGDLAVMPCANQLGPHENCSSRAKLVSSLKIPALAIGLGAQSKDLETLPEIPASTQQWVRAIAERQSTNNPNIAVRGEFTRRTLEKMGIRDQVEVLGCPSLFINDSPSLGKQIASKFKQKRTAVIGVAAGNPLRPVNENLERKLLNTAVKTGGNYIVQHPLPFIKVARGETSDLSSDWHTRLQSLFGQPISKANTFIPPPNISVFFDIDAWMECLRQHDLVIGMRIHGTMLALQAGTPALCIVHDSRTEELCEIMKIPYIHARLLEESPADMGAFMKYFEEKFDPIEFDKNRAKLAGKYISLLNGSGLAATREVAAISGRSESKA